MITSENARECQQKAVISRAIKTEQRKLAEEQAIAQAVTKQLAEQLHPLPEYSRETLARVRQQLDQLYKLWQGETDPGKLDRLASAQARLHEQERQLSNRPLPGTLRPVQSKPARSQPASEPVPSQSSSGPVPEAIQTQNPTEPMTNQDQ